MRMRSVTAAVAAFTLGLAVMSSAGATDDPDSTTTTPVDDTAAVQALSDAEALFDSDPATEPVVQEHHDATLALRDLLVHRNELSGTQRSAADRLLARPGGDNRMCGTFTCVHWYSTGSEAATPAFAQDVLDTMEHVHRTYVRAGYRAPLADNGEGGNNKRDIYLRDVGSQGLYGYCTSDQRPIGPPWRVYPYCVLDNDYAGFPRTPLANIQVTGAHEYFHAVQFAYDIGEDGWFMEATATWAEDELFDAINDNRQYLRSGQMHRSRLAMDSFGFNVYGNWIFFRYLTERMQASKGGLPTLVRDMWRAADFKGKHHDKYSLQAVKKVLAQHHKNFRTTYAAFAEANRRPAQAYEEGSSQAYKSPGLFANPKLSTGSRGSGWKSVKLDHLTSATAGFEPRGLGNSWKLKVLIDMAPENEGSAAVVTIYPTSGSPKVKHLNLNSKGNAQKTVAFGSVDHVEVTLVNASTRTTCGPPSHKGGGRYSCAGKPKDQNLKEKVKGIAVH